MLTGKNTSVLLPSFARASTVRVCMSRFSPVLKVNDPENRSSAAPARSVMDWDLSLAVTKVGSPVIATSTLTMILPDTVVVFSERFWSITTVGSGGVVTGVGDGVGAG